MRKNSIKNTRINKEVMRAIADIIRTEIKDPRLDPLTSVMSVEVAPDLKTCKVEVSVLGDEQHKEDTLKALRSASGYIRMLLAKKVDLRNTPELFFRIDNSTEYGIDMMKKIDEVMEEQRARAALRGDIEDTEETEDSEGTEEI
ncbi:MAG: 30S ribosome-binding factor RbfA [Lachnospiraceae bacterium]|nr:30S ribosome-binding factor RbfA [Lachnospiraceae bacterium]